MSTDLGSFYLRQLLDDCIPFWFPRAADLEHGGFLHCYDRDGSLSSTLKGSLWKSFFHHPRALWLCHGIASELGI